MKHLLLVVVVLVVIYSLWSAADPTERRRGARLITRHGLRLGALLVVVLALLALAYYIPSTNIL